MKNTFAVVLALAAAVSSAVAQKISIASPAPGANIPAGQTINVQVQEGDQLSSVREIGIAVTLAHCTQSPVCEDVADRLGQIFYAGPYSPQRLSPPSASGAPYQNVSITIPSDFAKGGAVISVPHAQLVGAGPFFFNEIANVTINIV